MTSRLGITIPLEGANLKSQIGLFGELENCGYSDLFSAEADSLDAFSPLAVAALETKSARLGTSVVPAYIRGPALLAMTVQAMSELAPNRFMIGIGTSSNVIVKNWNSIEFEKPLSRIRDTVDFLKKALSGEKVTQDYQSFNIKGFKLRRNPEDLSNVPILLGALRKNMLNLAVEIADGVITNFLSAADVVKVKHQLQESARELNKDIPELFARIFVVPTEDRTLALTIGRLLLNAYLNVPVYKEFHKWLGHSNELKQTWEAWERNDRKEALLQIPEDFVRSIVISGNDVEIASKIKEYLKTGVETPIIALIPTGINQLEVLKSISAHFP